MYIKLASQTVSAVASVSFDNCFSATYTHYLVVRNLSGTVALNTLTARLRTGGADATGANYRIQRIVASGSSSSAAQNTAQTSWNNGFLGSTETTAFGFSSTLISNPFDAAVTTAWANWGYAQTGNIEQNVTLYAHDLATSYDGISFILAQFGGASTGTMTGTITIYGLRES